jgi:hypothetical protein
LYGQIADDGVGIRLQRADWSSSGGLEALYAYLEYPEEIWEHWGFNAIRLVLDAPAITLHVFGVSPSGDCLTAFIFDADDNYIGMLGAPAWPTTARPVVSHPMDSQDSSKGVHAIARTACRAILLPTPTIAPFFFLSSSGRLRAAFMPITVAVVREA